MFVFRHTAPDRADDGRDILGPGCEVERVIVTLGSGHNVLQVAGHCLAHQDADRVSASVVRMNVLRSRSIR